MRIWNFFFYDVPIESKILYDRSLKNLLKNDKEYAPVETKSNIPFRPRYPEIFPRCDYIHNNVNFTISQYYNTFLFEIRSVRVNHRIANSMALNFSRPHLEQWMPDIICYASGGRILEKLSSKDKISFMPWDRTHGLFFDTSPLCPYRIVCLGPDPKEREDYGFFAFALVPIKFKK